MSSQAGPGRAMPWEDYRIMHDRLSAITFAAALFVAHELPTCFHFLSLAPTDVADMR